jgi:hypothetical protein
MCNRYPLGHKVQTTADKALYETLDTLYGSA